MNASRSFEIKRATCYEDALGCSSLLVGLYAHEGYMEHSDRAVRKMLAQSLIKSSMLLAQKDKEIIATISLIQSTPLPMAEVFPEVNRIEGNVAEVGRFASNQKGVFRVSMALMDAVLEEAKRRGISHLVCVVNPHHVGFYTRLGFETLCEEERPHLKVNGAPAIALIADIENKQPTRSLS